MRGRKTIFLNDGSSHRHKNNLTRVQAIDLMNLNKKIRNEAFNPSFNAGSIPSHFIKIELPLCDKALDTCNNRDFKHLKVVCQVKMSDVVVDFLEKNLTIKNEGKK
jgi:hypothetical protein